MPPQIYKIRPAGQAAGAPRAEFDDREIAFGQGVMTLRTGLLDQTVVSDLILRINAEENAQEPVPLDMSSLVWPSGEVVVDLDGELDIAVAEAAVSYVQGVIDDCRGTVIVDLKALTFCDVRGLRALLRMASHAERAGCEFRLVLPRPSIVKMMQITGLDRGCLVSGRPGPAGSQVSE